MPIFIMAYPIQVEIVSVKVECFQRPAVIVVQERPVDPFCALPGTPNTAGLGVFLDLGGPVIRWRITSTITGIRISVTFVRYRLRLYHWSILLMYRS